LFRHPHVGAAVADEDQSALRPRMLFHRYNDSTLIVPLMPDAEYTAESTKASKPLKLLSTQNS
jgi:hypothetical protein